MAKRQTLSGEFKTKVVLDLISGKKSLAARSFGADYTVRIAKKLSRFLVHYPPPFPGSR